MRVQTIHTKNLRWVDITNPKEEELNWVRENFKFHDLHLLSLTEHQQRPHIDEGAEYDFLVLLFPVYNRATKEIVDGEVDFFIGDKFLLTAHYGEIHTFKALFDKTKYESKTRDMLMKNGSGFLLYKVLESLFRRSYPILDHMGEDIQFIEQRIFEQANHSLLSRIAMMSKNVIEFRKMMKTHRYVLERLPKSRKSYLVFPQSKIYYRDLLEYSHNIWDILEAYKETTDTLSSTSQALATQRLNEITKAISILSAIILPATLIAFIFGLNVDDLPFKSHPNGFWIILIIMALASLFMVWYFRIRKWF